MGEVYGANIKNLNDVFHGMRTKMIQTEDKGLLFEDIPKEFYAGRYHSWVIDKNSDTSAFHINVLDSDGEIMAIQHKDYPLFGVQFHPESIMTELGPKMIANFLNYRQ
jgi:anthranilate synthase component 2